MPAGEQTILVVEDSARVRALVVEMLSSAGYRVLEAAGSAALGRLLSDPTCPVDLLLTDLMLPGMSGIEVANRVLAVCPDVKVLFMSGYQLFAHPEMAFIEKPFRVEELIEKVRGMLA